MSYVLAFLGFAALIILHEAGHFVAAKAVGMRVERFSLFFGPMLIRRTIGETEYGVGVIPLGGYVKITGMNPEEELPPEVAPRAYYNQPVWKRIVVILAGPAVNLLIAFVIIWALFLSLGQYVTAPGFVVASVQPHSAAAGLLKPGDQLVSLNGVNAAGNAIRDVISQDRCRSGQVNGCRAETPVKLVVRRHGQLLSFEVRPRYSAAVHRPLVGFNYSPRQVHEQVGAVSATSLTVTNLWRVTTQTVSAIVRIFEPKERRQLQGVVGAFAVTQQAVAASPSEGLQVIALISLSLAVINLFPFLPLDGGHVFWAVAEKVRGRRISFGVMERAGFVGFALIVLLFVIGLSNSISTLSGTGFHLH
jgi:regulator of sigma E protease